MLRAVPFKSAGRAHEYYTQALAKEDYWSKDAEVAGLWHGQAACKLGLKDEVKAESFEALTQNRHPITGEKITVRDRKGRVVGMDMSFGVPKSVSLLYAFTGDSRITELLMVANQKMMDAIEADAETQVRVGGKIEDRVTGNLAYATFLHHTSRPVGGIPDPHLHTHNFVFNLTFDGIEDRFKAVKFRKMKQNAPFYEAIGRSWLAHGLREMGYDVKKAGKAFEIEGIPRTLVQKYSRRTMQIERVIAEKGIKTAVAKAEVGARSREAKQSSMSAQDTLAAWTARLAEDEKAVIQKIVRNRGQVSERSVTSREAVDFALAHSFDKSSVVKMRDIFREAVAHGYGSLLPDEILKEIGQRNLITGRIKGVEYATTQMVLGEEAVMLDWARYGKGRFTTFSRHPHKIQRGFLSDEQVQAVKEMLYSHNQIIGLQGGAGVGKTTLMQEVVEGIQHSGKQVFAFAPTAKAAETLKNDGFGNATTLAGLLSNQNLQRQVKGQVIWLDEAGLIGVEDMMHLFRVVGSDTRIILSGDVNQHSPIARGDAFRLLQETEILRCSQVSAIVRQETGYYRDAAQAMADGDIDAAFGYLQAMGALNEIEDSKQRYKALAKQFADSLIAKESPLLVSPTHVESGKVTAAVRSRLRELKQLGPDKELTRLVNLQWSDAQKTKPEIYREGMVIEYHQNAKLGVKRGSRFAVHGLYESGQVMVADAKGRTRALNLEQAERFTVYREMSIDLARGDIIRMTKNGYFPDGRRFNNGQTYNVARIYPSGSFKLANGALVKADYGHIKHGYVSTSFSSQSQTISGPVFIAQDGEATGANSQNQFYVSLTRGKSKAHIFTSSVDELKENIRREESRISALEFTIDQSTMSASNEKKKQDPNQLSDAERKAIFNTKGEYRFSPGFVRHDVGGSFTDYVEHRRNKFSGISGQLGEARKEYLKGEKGMWANGIGESKKQWANHLDSKRKVGPAAGRTGLSAPSQKGGPSNWRGQVQARKQDWTKEIGKVRDKVVADAKSKIGTPEARSTAQTKQPGKGMGASPSAASKTAAKKPMPTPKAAVASVAPKVNSEAKGKGKDQAKAVPPPAKKPPAPKPPTVTVKK
jgi:conjugative relaxase-like TrwC/TraI family protein